MIHDLCPLLLSNHPGGYNDGVDVHPEPGCCRICMALFEAERRAVERSRTPLDVRPAEYDEVAP